MNYDQILSTSTSSVSNLRKEISKSRKGENDGNGSERKGIYQNLRVVVIAEIRLLKLLSLYLIKLNIGMNNKPILSRFTLINCK